MEHVISVWDGDYVVMSGGLLEWLESEVLRYSYV
jgi:hypothetical protein